MTTQNNKYTSTTAQVIANQGNTFQADIMQVADNHANSIMKKIDELKSEYWTLHQEVMDQSFPSSWEQAEALEKLGQLAIAMKALRQAYSAMNSVRCF